MNESNDLGILDKIYSVALQNAREDQGIEDKLEKDSFLEMTTVLQYLDSGDWIVLRFNSHRSRERALGHRQLLTERDAIQSGKWLFRACYSLERSSHGGYYVVESQLAEEVLKRNIPGVTRLRGGYNDLRWCW